MKDSDMSQPKPANAGPEKASAGGESVVCENIAFTAVDLLVEWLVAQAQQTPQGLNADSIRAVAQHFKQKGAAQSGIDFDAQFDRCMREREQEIWDQTRKNAFQRLLIKRISSLFPREGAMDPAKGMVSRRIIPGFLAALEMMAGKDMFEQCRVNLQDMVRAKRRQSKGTFQWRSMYEDSPANQCIDDVLVATVPYFRDLAHRIEWLHEVIEAQLAPPEDYAFEGELVYEWELKREHVAHIVKLLFYSLNEKVRRPRAQEFLKERYGETSVQALGALVSRLYPTD